MPISGECLKLRHSRNLRVQVTLAYLLGQMCAVKNFILPVPGGP